MTDHHRRRSWLSEAAIIATLLLLPFLFWWRLWALKPADRSTIPEGDFTSQYYPLQQFATQELAAGRLPAWNPYINAGQPGLADIQTGTFYPPNLLLNLGLALAGLPLTIELLTVLVIIHFSLASLFNYLFVRHLARRAGSRIGAARFAGGVAALAFAYGGYLTSFPVQQLTILETAVWLPLILLFLDRAYQHLHARPQVILAAMALACSLLAGHPQTAMYVVVATVAYGLFLAYASKRMLAPPASGAGANRLLVHFRRLCPLLATLVVGVALAAIQLIPTLVFILQSTRASLSYETVSSGFTLAEMTHLLYPGYFGGSPQYVGVLPPILAAAALFLNRERRQVAFWFVVGAVALFLSLGGHTFLYSVAYLVAPGFGVIRNQERIIYLFSFAVSILAGYGALTLAQPLPRLVRKGFRRFSRSLAWVEVAFLALTALFYYGHLQSMQQAVEINLFEGVLRHHILLLLILGGSVAVFALRQLGRARRRWVMALALSLIGLNLFTINWQFNLAKPGAGHPFVETGLVTFLRDQPGVFRISSAGLLPGGASAGAVYQTEDITANTPFRLDRFQQFADQLGSWRQWQLLNVHYVLDRRDLDSPGLTRVYEEEEVKVYRMGDPLPRAWLVHQVVTADDAQALRVLNAEEFDPAATAVLPPGVEISLDPGDGKPGHPTRILEARSGHLDLEVSATDDGLLVISQPFYPGWQAWVDGQRAPIHRVNYLLQGVPVGTGAHRVTVSYRLPLFPGIVSMAALLGCCGSLFLRRRRVRLRR